jgi:hypothetical protein
MLRKRTPSNLNFSAPSPSCCVIETRRPSAVGNGCRLRSPSIVLGDAGTAGAGGISSKGNSVDGKSGEENSAGEKSAAISAPNSPCSAAWSSSVAADGICGSVLPERSASERCSASNKRLMLSNSSSYYNLWFLLTAIALQEVVKLQQGISGAT